nr:MAG TPA: hypothetical protein [Caudoviricetes sp.]
MSKDLDADFKSLKAGTVLIKKFPDNAAGKPKVQGCGVVFSYKDSADYGWDIAIINGNIYTRNNTAGGIGTWGAIDTK